MRGASENFVPVTLELGGKSPVIVQKGYSLDYAAAGIAYGKLANAGQTCIAPDYLMVHEENVALFTQRLPDPREKYPPAWPREDCWLRE